jgi:Zn-dependent M28 family amino/carboxypeptidase
VFYGFENVVEPVFGKTDKQLFELAKRNLELADDLLLDFEEKDMQCSVNYYDTLEVLQTENITGYIKGQDTTKTIVLTAHYDHVGIVNGKIHYGADDNASGTAALLETARLLSIGEKPAYNVQFIAFSAEELGLLGSKEYVQHPFISLSQTLVNINMDMVGRWDSRHESNKDFVYLLSAGEHSVNWFKLGKLKAKVLPISVSKKPGAQERNVFTYGSDHFSFFQQGVPVVVVFTGLHDDYHTPRDVPEMINFDNLTNISTLLARMIFSGGEEK